MRQYAHGLALHTYFWRSECDLLPLSRYGRGGGGGGGHGGAAGEAQSLHSLFRLQGWGVRLHLFLAGSRGVLISFGF
jgi:hypothetical protein